MNNYLKTEEIRDSLNKLHAGDSILLTGTVYTARDAAHKRIFEMMDLGKELPFPLRDSVIYYTGPTQTSGKRIIGSCGPTTSARMDKFAPRLIQEGLVAMIGKGERSQDVVDAIKKYGAVYFAAIGGAGATAASRVTACETLAFPDLGCESIKKLTLKDFPLIVAIDAEGNDIFINGRKKYEIL